MMSNFAQVRLVHCNKSVWIKDLHDPEYTATVVLSTNHFEFIRKSNRVGRQAIMNQDSTFVPSTCVTAKLLLAITSDKSKHPPKKAEPIVQERKRCVTATVLSDTKQIYINNARDADKFPDLSLSRHSTPTNQDQQI